MRKNLKELRKKEGYTQKQLADCLGISERQYQSIESGSSDGSLKLWQKLREILNAPSIDYLSNIE